MKARQIMGRMGLLAPIALGLAAGCRDNASAGEPSQVSLASEALASAIGACGEELAACAGEARGDQTVLDACRAEFAACRETAGTGATNDLADAIRGCTEDARACRSADGADKQACQEALVTCLGDNRPEPPAQPEHDGGGRGPADPGDRGGSPVASCIDTLLECVQGDGSARECAQAVRACILEAVPRPDGVPPTDPGMSGEPHGNDGGMGMAGDPPRADAGMGMAGDPPGADAGMGMAPPKPDCKEQFEACVAGGGSRMECAREQRECGTKP